MKLQPFSQLMYSEEAFVREWYEEHGANIKADKELIGLLNETAENRGYRTATWHAANKFRTKTLGIKAHERSYAEPPEKAAPSAQKHAIDFDVSDETIKTVVHLCTQVKVSYKELMEKITEELATMETSQIRQVLRTGLRSLTEQVDREAPAKVLPELGHIPVKDMRKTRDGIKVLVELDYDQFNTMIGV